MPDPRIKWHELDIVPTANMEFWHTYEAGVSGNGAVADYSGNTRTLAGSSPPPILQSNVVYGQPAWYFNGTDSQVLVEVGAVTDPNVNHYFGLISHDGAAFDAERGVVGGLPGIGSPLLISSASGTKFQNLGYSNFTYRKNGTAYEQANQQAPMSRFELVEVVTSSDIFGGGVRVGHAPGAPEFWKGWWADHMGFTGELATTTRRRVLLYYMLRYGLHLTAGSALELYFPSSDLVSGAIRNRFYNVPREWDVVTEDYEFEDSNKTFNEFAGEPPRRWEYTYVNVSKAQAQLFDVFYDTVRHVTPFKFKDPEGYVWNNVRIERYERTHEAHKRWLHTVDFRLVGYNSTATYEG